jgi:hypothetical protein
MRLKLIACEVLFREMCNAVARAPHQVDLDVLPKGLHDLGATAMRTELQHRVDGAGSSYDAVVFGYALCGNGLLGIEARAIPLVLPRAHDCIALLMGSRQRYQQYFDTHPGTYFRSTGWLERGQSIVQLARPRAAAGYSLEELVARYGEDNGRYLYEEMNRYQTAYCRLTFIETGLEPDNTHERRAREEAAGRNWSFEKIAGDSNLFHRLVAGDWDPADFLVVPPGCRVAARYDDNIIGIERIPPCP